MYIGIWAKTFAILNTLIHVIPVKRQFRVLNYVPLWVFFPLYTWTLGQFLWYDFFYKWHLQLSYWFKWQRKPFVCLVAVKTVNLNVSFDKHIGSRENDVPILLKFHLTSLRYLIHVQILKRVHVSLF